MLNQVFFSKFFAIDEKDAPELLARMSKHDLPVDGERYGVFSRLIAKPEVTPADLGTVVLHKLLQSFDQHSRDLGAIVLSSRIAQVQEAAQEIGKRVGADCPCYGIERACSGFPAATELGVKLCRELDRTVAVVTSEIMSTYINWEPVAGDSNDHSRARGQAAKIFGDAAAAVLVSPVGQRGGFEILDAWADEVPDDKQLIQKTAVNNSMDPWSTVRPGETDCMSMPGRNGFLLVRRAPLLLAQSLEKSFQHVPIHLMSGTQLNVVPHQANGLILLRLQQQLSSAADTARVWQCIKDSGNTVSASIPMAMSFVQDELPSGSLVAMPSVGAGGPGYRPDVLSIGCVLARVI